MFPSLRSGAPARERGCWRGPAIWAYMRGVPRRLQGDLQGATHLQPNMRHRVTANRNGNSSTYLAQLSCLDPNVQTLRQALHVAPIHRLLLQ